MRFSDGYLARFAEALGRLDTKAVEGLAHSLAAVRREGGRVFVLGLGGSASSAAHAVCDLRTLADIEAYSPTDNAAELTARINDDGWSEALVGWLRASRLRPQDAVLVLSVGGGSLENNVSVPLVTAMDYAKSAGSHLFAIVGRDGGHARLTADVCVLIPAQPPHVCAHTESLHAVVWHLLMSHPDVQRRPYKWDAVEGVTQGRE